MTLRDYKKFSFVLTSAGDPPVLSRLIKNLLSFGRERILETIPLDTGKIFDKNKLGIDAAKRDRISVFVHCNTCALSMIKANPLELLS